MATLVKNIRGLNASQVVSKVHFIEGRMKDNPAFPVPAPSLADIALAREALEAAITAAKDGGRTATAIRRARQRELTLLLNQLGGYVSSIAEGNGLAILSSGFEVKRTGQPTGEPHSRNGPPDRPFESGGAPSPWRAPCLLPPDLAQERSR